MSFKQGIVFILSLIAPLLLQAQIYNSEIQAKINLDSNGEFTVAEAAAANLTQNTVPLYYVFSVNKKNLTTGKTGRDELTNRFTLEPESRIDLGSLPVVAAEDERVIVLLLIYNVDDQIVGKDRVELSSAKRNTDFERDITAENEISEDLNYAGEDGFLLRGIVVESTITKPGRDFFRLYNDKYDTERINGEQVVTVEEVLAVGTNTQIKVIIEYETIVQFFLNPRASLLEEKADYAILMTKRYFKNLKENRESIKKY